MLESSPTLRTFLDYFKVSDLRAKEGKFHGTYFFLSGMPEWSGRFTPKNNLACPAMATLVFEFDSDDIIQTGISPQEVLQSLEEVCDAPFIKTLVNEYDHGMVRLRAAGDRLHWNTDEVQTFYKILKDHNYELPPIKEWIQIILDVGKAKMISFYHPKGTNLYIVEQFGFNNNPDWCNQYEQITGEKLDTYCSALRDKYCPVVNSQGELKLLEIGDK